MVWLEVLRAHYNPKSGPDHIQFQNGIGYIHVLFASHFNRMQPEVRGQQKHALNALRKKNVIKTRRRSTKKNMVQLRFQKDEDGNRSFTRGLTKPEVSRSASPN